MIEWMITTGLAVSALLALVLLTRRRVARHFGPRAAYALWLLPIARLAMPSIALPAAWIPQILRPVQKPEPLTAPYLLSSEPVLLTTQPVIATQETAWTETLLPIAFSVWIAGIVLGLLWLLATQYLQMRKIRATSEQPDSRTEQDIARAICLSGLKRAPEVRISETLDGPFVIGLSRPIIVLPRTFASQFNPEQRRLALIHEMMHVKRGDLWAASAMFLFRLLNWPNPLVHWAWPRFRSDQEAACDASVLRQVGEQKRSDYAETLLTAAKSAGRASPVPAAGLSLSLHHPVKERLMILGSNTDNKHGLTRWALAAMLLAGTALSAPLSFADDPEQTAQTPKIETKSVHVSRFVTSSDDGSDYKGLEIRDEDGQRTYLRVSRDGTTEQMTREELEAEYGDQFSELLNSDKSALPERLAGEPGLNALTRSSEGQNRFETLILKKNMGSSTDRIEVEVEDGVRKIFRIEEDGTKTELSDDIFAAEGSSIFFRDGDSSFPFATGKSRIEIITTDDEHSFWTDDGTLESNSFVFGLGGQNGNSAMAEARLRTAESMLESTDRMLDTMRENAEGSAANDLRDAERQLEKARKALEKAREAVKKSETR